MSENREPKQARAWAPLLWREPAAGLSFLAASTSIGSLVLYLAGVAEFSILLRWLLVPGTLLLLTCLLWARRREKGEFFQRVLAALWAGLVATLMYDLVRVPAVLAGMPVFKAISYFGTVMLNQAAPSIGSEFAGWAYHLSNGIGFGVMYALLVGRPSWWTAVLWGLSLEGFMLLTPYAEVFGYSVSGRFLAITLSAHVVYGLTLWGALHFFLGAGWVRRAFLLAGPGAVAVFGIGLIGADFYGRFARSLPPSPPNYIGRSLYTTWDVPEADRVVAAWVWQRYVDPHARFHFVRPFSQISRGIPFDLPEAEVRRSATRSATENLLTAQKLDNDPVLAKLGRMTHLTEITPWMAASDLEPYELSRQLSRAVEPHAKDDPTAALRAGFKWLDAWYNEQHAAGSKH